MTLRSRLAWAFSAMLLVPIVLLLLFGALVRWWWDPAVQESSQKDILQAVSVLNAELNHDPQGLLEGSGFDRLASSLPRGASIGTKSDGAWIRTSAGFDDPAPGPPWRKKLPQTLFVWNFEASSGHPAQLEVRWSPRVFVETWGGWALGGVLGVLILLIATNGTLTWLVSRSVMRPLALLEAAAHRLGEGDLDPGPLPLAPPEFRRVGQAFDDMRRRLKDSLNERQALEEERRTWVASVSHDLRTPLAVIRGFSEGLRDGVAATPEKRARYQSVIASKALQLERQVDDLFQWARWDWGQPKLAMQTLDLAEELQAAVTSWATDWPDLEVFYQPQSLPRPLRADPVALRRLFDNLVRNIVQHAGPHPRLHLDLVETEGYELSFRDQGPGLSPGILPRVFERFFRGDPARNPAQGGGGLGLTIAKTLAEAQGGTVVAANHPQGGAVFTVLFPKASFEEPL